MEKEKVIRYHLKNDVRDDLENLYLKLGFLLSNDVDGFANVPTNKSLPELFKVFSHLLWNRRFETWFKKVYW